MSTCWWHDKQWAMQHQTCTLPSISRITKILRSNQFYKNVTRIKPPSFSTAERILPLTRQLQLYRTQTVHPSGHPVTAAMLSLVITDKLRTVMQFQGQHISVCGRSEVQRGSLQCRTVQEGQRGAQRAHRVVHVHTMT